MDRFVFLLIQLALVASDDRTELLLKHLGETATLECEAGDISIRAVEWTRDDLEPPQYILFYTNGHSDPTHQLSTFENRVQLANRELKNGNVSLILRNISANDSGMYECRVADGRSGRNKRAIIDTDPIRKIKLVVTDSGSKKEHTNLNAGPPTNVNSDVGHRNHVGVIAAGLVCSAVVGLVVAAILVRKSKRHSNNQSEQPAADEAVGDQLI